MTLLTPKVNSKKKVEHYNPTRGIHSTLMKTPDLHIADFQMNRQGLCNSIKVFYGIVERSSKIRTQHDKKDNYDDRTLPSYRGACTHYDGLGMITERWLTEKGY